MGRKVTLISLVTTLGSALVVSASAADVCQGPRATAGSVVSGPVLQISDGSSLCVAIGPLPSTWIAIRLANPPSDRSTLMAAAFGKNAACAIDRGGRGHCLIEGASLADALHRPAIVKVATSWR